MQYLHNIYARSAPVPGVLSVGPIVLAGHTAAPTSALLLVIEVHRAATVIIIIIIIIIITILTYHQGTWRVCRVRWDCGLCGRRSASQCQSLHHHWRPGRG